MPQFDPFNPYRDAARRLRAAFGSESDHLPSGALHRLLTLLGESEPMWADAEVIWGDQGLTNGRFVVLTETRLLTGGWEKAKATGFGGPNDDALVSIRVVARSSLRVVELPDCPGRWLVRNDAQQPEPWTNGATVKLTYDGLNEPVKLPLGSRVSQTEFQPVLQLLLNDLNQFRTVSDQTDG